MNAQLDDPRIAAGMAAQLANRRERIAAGEKPIGWKVGLSTEAAMKSLSTNAPLVGFLTDAAYIVDFEHGVEFLLAATLYVNRNETFNDDTYEYDEIGLPFLRELGQAIYEIELERPREHRPDLAELAQLRDD